MGLTRKLLVLDLDETLFHAARRPLERAPDLILFDYFVYWRPYAQHFIASVASWYEVAVWSSAGKLYVERALEALVPPGILLSFVWSRERCTQGYDPATGEHYWIKDLKKLRRRGYRLEHVLVVDDSPEKLERNYGNWVPVRPYLGAADDTELLELIPYLEHLSGVENVRTVEKRYWRGGSYRLR
ncbi:HAD family hydrolase [Calidithermus chliarophilus]|uniref:HAD family hydrolase n=1 Tax=Calidithermus chliarophilus TaxID=52023 RepID=UPI000482A4F6|nr:HAD family hydrolase [Calidithermus chliarophilus]